MSPYPLNALTLTNTNISFQFNQPPNVSLPKWWSQGRGALNIFEFNNMGISKAILLHHTVSGDTFKNI